MSVVLEDGARHLGWLYDQSEATPPHAAVLQRDGQTVTLRMPLAAHVDEIYQRWFQAGMHHTDDPDKARYDYRPPATLWFAGDWGSAALVDCYARSWSTTTGSHGEAVIGCSMAVVRATTGMSYDAVDSVESAVPGLGLWLGRTALDSDITRGSDGLPEALDVRWHRQESTSLASRMNLTVHPSFRFSSRIPGDSELLAGNFVLNTRMARPRPWREHINTQRAVPSLMTISSWHPWGLENIQVHRDDDPERALDGTPRGHAWRDAVVAGLSPVEAPPRRPRFLFGFEDIPGSPITRWLRLQALFEEPLARLVRVAQWKTADVVGVVQELGTIVELVGYAIGKERGVRPKEQFERQAIRVLEQLPNPLRDVAAGWPKEFRDTYTDAKHADNVTPDGEALWRGKLMTQLILRCWVAARLGMDGNRLCRLATVDPQARRLGLRFT